MKIQTLLLVGLLCTFLANCQRSIPDSGVTTLTPGNIALLPTSTIPSPTFTIPPSQTATPTKTHIPPTPTPVFISERVAIDVNGPECAGKGIAQKLPQNFSIPGELVMLSNDRTAFVSFSGSTITQRPVPLDIPKGMVAAGAPDGKRLAFVRGNRSADRLGLSTVSVQILSSDGTIVKHSLDVVQFEPEIYDHRFLGVISAEWINNQLLYIILEGGRVDGRPTGYVDTIPKIIDTVTGEWRNDLFEKLPNLYEENQVGFSPDLSRAIFTNEDGTILQDIGAGTYLLTDDKFFPYRWLEVGWSPDGNWAAYGELITLEDHPTMYLISRDGTQQKILQGSELSFIFWELRWSPDSRFLAFVETDDVQTDLILYDVKDDRYLYHCPIVEMEAIRNSITWSPDSSMIALWGLTEARTPKAQILDVKSGELYDLLQPGTIMGWLGDPQQ